MKLILEQYYTQQDMKPFYDSIEKKEFEYIKKPVRLLYRIAVEPEKIETIIDNEKETDNIAKIGDWILTGVKGEKYVLSEKKVKEKYDIIDANTIKAKPSRIKAKEYDEKKIEQGKVDGSKNLMSFVWQNSTYRILEMFRKENNRNRIARFISYEEVFVDKVEKKQQDRLAQ